MGNEDMSAREEIMAGWVWVVAVVAVLICGVIVFSVDPDPR
jgi:hypothetical protein